MIKNLVISILFVIALASNNLLLCDNNWQWLCIWTIGVGMCTYIIHCFETLIANIWNLIMLNRRIR